MKYLITIQYDGSNFYGFQRQNNKRTVQNEIEKALTIINKAAVEIKGAGRTDKGVHAYGQRACFNLNVNVPIDRLMKALNDILPVDIYIVGCEMVEESFHPRFNVKEKTYVYKINIGKYDPLWNKYYYQIPYPLDIKKLKKASRLFVGIHHFNNFVSGERANYEAIIYSIKLDISKSKIIITFKGKSFYRYMVRNMVGAMLDVARNKVSLTDIKSMLDNYNEVKELSCAPAEGLYLMNIKY